MSEIRCPIAYDHDDLDEQPCAVCGWDPTPEPAPRMSSEQWAGIEGWINAFNQLTGDGCCPGQTAAATPATEATR